MRKKKFEYDSRTYKVKYKIKEGPLILAAFTTDYQLSDDEVLARLERYPTHIGTVTIYEKLPEFYGWQPIAKLQAKGSEIPAGWIRTGRK